MSLELFPKGNLGKDEVDAIVRGNVEVVQNEMKDVLFNHHGANLDASQFERFFMKYDEYTSHNDGFNDKVLGLLSVMETNDDAFHFLINLRDRFGRPCFDSFELKVLQSRDLSTDTQYFVLKIAYLISMHLLDQEDESKITESEFLNDNKNIAISNRNKYVKSEVLKSDTSLALLAKFSQIFRSEVREDESFYTIELDSSRACLYQAHGALNRVYDSDALKKLLTVLQDPSIGCKDLYTCPLASDNSSAFGALGAVSPYRGSDFWLISAKNETLEESGVRIVACKDSLKDLIPLLQESFPQVIFVTASELNNVI